MRRRIYAARWTRARTTAQRCADPNTECLLKWTCRTVKRKERSKISASPQPRAGSKRRALIFKRKSRAGALPDKEQYRHASQLSLMSGGHPYSAQRRHVSSPCRPTSAGTLERSARCRPEKTFPRGPRPHDGPADRRRARSATPATHNIHAALPHSRPCARTRSLDDRLAGRATPHRQARTRR